MPANRRNTCRPIKCTAKCSGCAEQERSACSQGHCTMRHSSVGQTLPLTARPHNAVLPPDWQDNLRSVVSAQDTNRNFIFVLEVQNRQNELHHFHVKDIWCVGMSTINTYTIILYILYQTGTLSVPTTPWNES